MSMTDGLIAAELRTIITNGEDVAAAWGDEELIAEASRRAHGRAGSMVTSGPDAAAMDHWLAVIAACRQETDREEGAHTRVVEGVRAQLYPLIHRMPGNARVWTPTAG